jgi:hypothetical protein
MVSKKDILPPTGIDQDKCPVCLTEKYLNQNLKLLVSPCFHKMCENCVNRIFLGGPAVILLIDLALSHLQDHFAEIEFYRANL